MSSPDAVVARLTTPDDLTPHNPERLATDPPRPTLADYGIDKHTPDQKMQD